MISYVMRVLDWTPEQVADWFLGLDDVLRPYAHAFLNNNVDGRHLVILCSDDLHNLNIWKLGHQELILEAVEHLGQSYFNLDAENLQWLALRLSCKARSLYNELPAPSSPDVSSEVDGDEDDRKQRRRMRDHVATKTLSAVADVVASVKSVICWLDGPPFEGQESYSSMRTILLQLCVELAMNAQRDKFAEEPNTVIRNICHKMATMCDDLIQESRDPLILQPASLDVATVRKKPNEELGMHIQSLYFGSHVIGRVKYQSPASSGGRVERGDEIVQVNYRTVVGWTLKKLVFAMKENPIEVVLTLKKRPKHALPFGRIFPQHFLFAAKTLSPKPLHRCSGSSKYSGSSKGKTELKDALLLPPPPALFPLKAVTAVSSNQTETTTEDEDDDSAFLSEVDSRSSADVHLVVPKLQVALQRRATVTGASPTACRPPVSIDQLWHAAKRDAINRCNSYDMSGKAPGRDSMSLMDVSAEKGNNVEPALPPSLANMGRRATCAGRVDSRNDSPAVAVLREVPSHVSGIVVQRTVSERDLSSKELLKSAVKSNSGTGSCENFNQPMVPSVSNEIKCNVTSSLLCSTSSFQSDSNAEEVIVVDEERSICKSYEVVIVGGVAHKCSPPLRDVKRSPLSSPSLRHKIKRWEFASRRISCKDLGRGDCEGWLYRGFSRKGGLRSGHKWNKRWCILKANGLFVYVDQQDLKAECFICLVGFSISPAPEYKSKKYAFKVYHTGTEFYFASDSQLDMSKWMNKMGLAAISFDTRMCISNSGLLSPSKQTSSSKSVFFSESEDDIEDTKSIRCEKMVCLESASGSSTSPSETSSYLSGKLVSMLESQPPPRTSGCAQSASMPSSSRREPDESASERNGQVYISYEELSSKHLDMHSATTQTVPVEDSSTEVLNRVVVQSSCSGTLPLPPSHSTKRNAEQKLPKALSLEWKGNLFDSFPPDALQQLPTAVGTGSEPPVKLSLAFEMNLDSSPPRELMDDDRRIGTFPHGVVVPSSLQETTSRSLRLSAFKLFGSPKFVKKLTGYHGRPDVKPLDGHSHSMWFGDDRATSSHSSSQAAGSIGMLSSSDKRLLGSPRLARAFFRAIHHKKSVATYSDEQKAPLAMTDTDSTSDLDYRVLQSVRISSIPSRQEDEISVVSATSAPVFPVLNTKLPASHSLDHVSDAARPIVRDAARTSLKPAMGVSMIGKQRRSSSSQSEGRSSNLVHQGHHQQPMFASMASQGTQTDNVSSGHDYPSRKVTPSRNVDLHPDGTSVSVRRKNFTFRPQSDERFSLHLGALKRTLSARRRDVEDIDRLLGRSRLTSDVLRRWLSDHPHLCTQTRERVG